MVAFYKLTQGNIKLDQKKKKKKKKKKERRKKKKEGGFKHLKVFFSDVNIENLLMCKNVWQQEELKCQLVMWLLDKCHL